MGRLKQVGVDVEVHRLIEQHRRSFSESVNDILGRVLPLIPAPAPLIPATAPLIPASAPLVPASAPLIPASAPLVPASAPLIPASAPLRLAGSGAASPPPGTRTRGQWTVEIEGRRIPARNLKAAYRTLLEALSERSPDFLARFGEEKGRSRRFVARTPVGLYGASPHLAENHAEPLVDGWYFDTNLSAAQVSARARIAARLCGLRYGADIRILENLREI